MATIEQLNALLDESRLRPGAVMPSQPAAQPVDLSGIVRSLQDVADALMASAETSPEEGQSQDLAAAAQTISDAVAPIAAAIQSIEIPAPVVNVAPAPVTVEREGFPRRATVFRDRDGLIESISFTEADEIDEPEDSEYDVE